MNRISEPSVRFSTFEQLLEQDGRLVYTVVGMSMLPILRQRRDIVEIRAKGSQRFRKYDVVLYKRGDKYILHRILRVLPQGYLIAGDNNTFLERDVTDGMILGVMVRIICSGRSIRPQDWRYRLYVRLWCAPWPLRMALLRAYRACRRFLGGLLRPLRRGAGGKPAKTKG